MHEIVKKIVF